MACHAQDRKASSSWVWLCVFMKPWCYMPPPCIRNIFLKVFRIWVVTFWSPLLTWKITSIVNIGMLLNICKNRGNTMPSLISLAKVTKKGTWQTSTQAAESESVVIIIRNLFPLSQHACLCEVLVWCPLDAESREFLCLSLALFCSLRETHSWSLTTRRNGISTFL